MLNLYRLSLLAQLDALGTLAAVADEQGCSPSAVSQQLAALQDEVGTPLIRAQGRGVVLTEQGHILVKHAAILQQQAEAAEIELANSLGEISGKVTIASFQTASMFFVPAALSNLRERFPKLEVRLVSYEPEAALPKLKSRELDLVIAEEYPGHGLGADPLLERDLLIEDRLQICVPKSLPRSANLTALPWAVEPLGGIARAWTTTLWSELAIAPTIGFESADIMVHKQLVSSGLAIAVLPSLVLQKEQSGLRVWSRDFLAAREICVVRRSSSAGNPALAHIIDELRNCAQQASGKL